MVSLEIKRQVCIFVVGLKLVKQLGQSEVSAQVRHFHQNIYNLQFERCDCRRYRRELVPSVRRLERLVEVFEIRAAVEDRNEKTKEILDLFMRRLKSETYKCCNETNLI